MRIRALLVVALLLAAGAAAADPTVLSVSGRVEIGRGTPPVWRAARSGDRLAPGDSVRTAAGARAELALGDQRTVRVYEHSMLRVGTGVTLTGAVRSVDLDEGRSLFDVMKKTVADEFEVITPEIVVSVKGTRFLVAAVPGDDWTAVFRGEVGLAGEAFEAISVRPGLLGARGELFLAPFGDPWAAWEAGAPAPEPALDERRSREVGAALQAAVAAARGGAPALGKDAGRKPEDPAGGNDGLAGDLLAAADGGAERVTDPLFDPPGGDPTLVDGAQEVVEDVLTPVSDVIDPVLDPVEPLLEPLDPLLEPILDPVAGRDFGDDWEDDDDDWGDDDDDDDDD